MTDLPISTDGGEPRTILRIATWMFRVYFLGLLAGIIMLGVAWYTGGIVDRAELIAGLWYAIAAFGTVLLALLVGIWRVTNP